MLMRGAVGEREMWAMPFRRFMVYLKHAVRIEGEEYLNLLTIATNPHVTDKDGNTKEQRKLFDYYRMIGEGLNPATQQQLKSDFFKAAAGAKRKQRPKGRDVDNGTND